MNSAAQATAWRRLLPLALAAALPCCLANKSNASMRCVYGEFPNDGFPGPNEALTNAAWQWGRQPKKSECWPMDPATGQPQACAEVSVIQDTETGWPGKCEGLVHVTPSGAELADLCGTDCMQKASCSTWQIGDDETCWQGLGLQCYRRPDFHPKRAQRLQHGEVRVLMNLKGWQITGLDQAFGVKGDGHSKSDDDAIDACRKVCYSNVLCNYWSYIDNSGCWVENPAKGLQYTVAYPLTLAHASRDSSDAQHSIAGEYIQHYCPSAAVYPPTPPPFPWCQSVGVRFSPSDMTGQVRSVEPNALLCQERCQAIEGCAYYSYWPSDGGCHLQDTSARVVAEAGAYAGPAHCPATPEPPNALCSAHPMCADLGLTGDCCPRDGTTLDCCNKNGTEGGTKGGGGFINGGDGTDVGSKSGWALIQMRFPNLTYSCLSQADLAELSPRYVFEVAAALGVGTRDIRDMENQQGHVEIEQGAPGGTLIAAVVPIVNGKSLGDYRNSVFTDTDPYYFEGNIVNATISVVGKTSSCIAGPLTMVDRSVELTSAPPATTQPAPATWFELWWPLLLALLLLCCAICIIGAICFSLRVPKSKRTSQVAPVVEEYDERPLLVSADEETRKHLPFPEVGLRSHLPFPEAGLPDDFTEKHRETAEHMHLLGPSAPSQPMPLNNPACPSPQAGLAQPRTTAGQPLYHA